MIPFDFEQQLPHRPPMLMLSHMLQQEAEHVHCNSIINEHNPLLNKGLFPVMGGVELLAQAAGTLLGLRSPSLAARAGAIVQIKSFQVEQADIPIGSELHIHARFQSGTEEAAFFEGEVLFFKQRFFTARLMIALLAEETA